MRLNESMGEDAQRPGEQEDICWPPGRRATTKQPAADTLSLSPSLNNTHTDAQAHTDALSRMHAYHASAAPALRTASQARQKQWGLCAPSQCTLMEEWAVLCFLLSNKKKKIFSIKIGSCPGNNKANLVISTIR